MAPKRITVTLFPHSTSYNRMATTLEPLQNSSIGDFCVARFSEDSNWYRARVVLRHGSESSAARLAR